MPKPVNQPDNRIITQIPDQAATRPGRRLPRQTQDKAADTQSQAKKKQRNTIFTVVAITLVIAIVVSIGYYLIYAMPFQRVIIKVENDVVKIDYFLKRVLNNPSGDDIWGTLENVVYEMIIKQEAPKYGIDVTPADIDQALRDAAKGGNETITDAEFREWYRQSLNISTYTDKEFKEVVKRSLEMQRMQQLLADQVPNTAEQGHIYYIIVQTYEEAVAVKERADNGEDFLILAKELSLDTSTKDRGGEIGWMPFAVLDDRFSSMVSGLDLGVCSDPIMAAAPDPSSQDPNAQNPPFALFMVSEKDVAREVTADQLETLKGRALQDWVEKQMSVKKITFHSLHGTGGFDSETEAWLSYQIQRMRKAISGPSTATATDTTTQGQTIP